MMLFQAWRFCSGDFRRSTLLFVLVPLIAVSYFGTLALAIVLFPERYDWRYRVISNLISARYNPTFHWIPSLGIALAGVSMIPFTGYIQRRLRLAAPRTAALGAGAFAVGVMALILAGLVVSSRAHGPTKVPRVHEIFGRTAALGLGVGMVLFWWCTLKGHCTGRARKGLYRRKLLVSWTLLTWPPLVGMAVSEGLLLTAQIRWPWSHAIYASVRNSVAWHLGFWEWIGSAAVFLFLVSSALFLPERVA